MSKKIVLILTYLILSTTILSKNIKIVTLTPNFDKILKWLNKENSIVGVSKFSPFKNIKPIVGDVTSINYEKIYKLKPNWIITLKNGERRVKILKKIPNLKILSLKFNNLSDILYATERISCKIFNQCELKNYPFIALFKGGEFLNYKPLKGVIVVDRDRKSLKNIYLSGGDSFISEFISILGVQNIIEKKGYPKIDIEFLISKNPDIIFDLTKDGDIKAWDRYKNRLKAIKNKKLYQIFDDDILQPSPSLVEKIFLWKKKYEIR